MSSHSEPAVGIDLGTTYSAVGYLDSNGRPATILNSEGDPITPSAVLFDDASVVVGKEALKAASLEPENVALFAKRDMGNASFHHPIRGEHVPPEVIQSLILERLKRDAEAKIGSFKKVVITVPAYFNEPRRKATQDAGQLAGLEVIDIINEPTAAAIAFGVQEGFLSADGQSKKEEIVLVYDLGGGTFDVTLMKIDGNHYTTLGTDGDVYLGGIDWDERLVNYIADSFAQKFRGIDPRQNPAGNARLRREAEEAKRSLTAREKVTVTFEHAGEGLRLPISRDQFENLTCDLLDRTRFTVVNLLKEAKLAWKDLTRVLLVGGSTRMPMIANMLHTETGLPIDQSLSADESVAHGAAIYAGLLLNNQNDPNAKQTVKNVNSHSLGVLGLDPDTRLKRTSFVIPKNSMLPVTKGKLFQTAQADQRSVEVNIVEGGNASGQGATAIGKCSITSLPPGLPAGTRVEVYFHYRENGRLTVHARIPEANCDATLELERASGLSDQKLAEWGAKLREHGPLQME